METPATYIIKEITWPERVFATRRATVPFDKLPDFFSTNYGAIYGFIQSKGVPTNDAPCAIFYTIDEGKKETDLAAAVPVSSDFQTTGDVDKLVLPSCKVLTTTHIGSFHEMMPAYQAMDKYMSEHGLQKTLIIEQYYSDPTTEKDPAKWRTDIHFILK